MLTWAHATLLFFFIVCALFPTITAQTKVQRCSFPGVTCKSCVFRYESGTSYKASNSKCGWCGSTPSNASDPTATAGYCLADDDRKSKKEKCGFSDNVFTTGNKDSCDNDYIDPALIYVPISTCSVVSAGSAHFWASKWRVSRQIKWLVTIIGLLLPIVSLFLVQYLYRKGHFNSAATEQPCPEIQLHAVEPVSGAEPQGALGLETTPKQATAEEIQIV
jgi:hypothetical protein